MKVSLKPHEGGYISEALVKIVADFRKQFEGGVPLIASYQGEAFIAGYRAEFEAELPEKIKQWLRVFHPELLEEWEYAVKTLKVAEARA